MRVKLLYFGVLKDLLGGETEEVEVTEGATVGDLLRILAARTSNVTMQERMWYSLAVAVNREYGSSSVVLHEGDEVALLPPVSGGAGAK
jgi:molybdopterin converting factor subunit 1